MNNSFFLLFYYKLYNFLLSTMRISFQDLDSIHTKWKTRPHNIIFLNRLCQQKDVIFRLKSNVYIHLANTGTSWRWTLTVMAASFTISPSQFQTELPPASSYTFQPMRYSRPPAPSYTFQPMRDSQPPTLPYTFQPMRDSRPPTSSYTFQPIRDSRPAASS